jgi:hypothetical protein
MKKFLLTAGLIGGAVAVGVKLVQKHNLVERGGVLAMEASITAKEYADQAMDKVTALVDGVLTKVGGLIDQLTEEEPTGNTVGEPGTAPQDFSGTGVGWPEGQPTRVDDTQDLPTAPGGRL